MEKINFYTQTSLDDTPELRMVIDVSGNVGIGEKSPNKKLEVAGDISFNGNLYQNGSLFTSGGGGGGLTDLSATSISDLSDVSFNSTSTTNGQALVWNSTDAVWEAGTVASSGSSIDETTDVSVNNLTVHHSLDVSNSLIVTDGSIISTSTTTYWYDVSSNFIWSLTNDGTSSAPTSRKHHSSIIDNSSNIVVFGGYDSTNSETNDVWKYNITNNTWSQLFTSTTPTAGAWDQITGSNASSKYDGATVYNNEIYILSDNNSIFEKYNPSTNTWTTLSVSSSFSFYGYHQMVSYNGHIYLVDNVNGYRSVWDYNISTNSWSQISNVSDTSHDRYNAAVMVYNNNIYIYGGRHIPYQGGYLNDIWKFNLTNNTWSEITGTTVTLDGNSGSKPSIGYSYFTSKDDNLYMFGGIHSGSDSNKLYIYNVTNNTLTGYTTSISARNSGTASIQGNYLYLSHGYISSNLNELIKYDLTTNTHTTISQSGTWPSARRDIQPKPVTIGNTFYIMGGYINNHSTEIWRYTLDNTPNKIKHSSSILNGDEIVTIFGGSNGSTYYNSILNFNLVSNSWLNTNVVKDNNASNTEHGNSSGLPSPRHGHTSVKYNNKMYMFGGKDGSTTYYDTWEYDLNTNTWTKKALASSSYARYEHSSIIYNGDMYVFGGYNGSTYFNNILKYDITNDTWSEYNDGTDSGTPTARYGHISVIMETEMIIFGGTTQSGHVEDSYMFNFVNTSWNLLDNDDSNRPTDSYSTTAEIQYYNPSENHYKLFVFGGETPLTNKLYVADISNANITTNTTSNRSFTYNKNNDGRVGIHTLNPTKTLDVDGDINFSGSLYQDGSIVTIGSSSITRFNPQTNLTINSLNTINDISFSGNLYQNGALFTSGVSNGDDISFNNLDISGVLRGTSGYNNNQISLGAHIIPTSNAVFDLGNAEYKIRHLFLSDNSLWIGDDHKIDISGGKMKFKKRKKNIVPTSIVNNGGTDSAALAFAGVGQLSDMTLHHWESYAKTLSGLETASVKDIFQTEISNDWEEDLEMNSGGGGLTDLSATSINDLSDVSFNSTSTIGGQSLIWNNTDKLWESGTILSQVTSVTTAPSNSGYAWSQISASSGSPNANSSHAGAIHGDYFYLFAGGDGNNNMYRLHLTTNAWSEVSYSTSGTILSNLYGILLFSYGDYVYCVFGSRNVTGYPSTNQILRYHTTNNILYEVSTSGTTVPTRQAGAIALYNDNGTDYLYYFGGRGGSTYYNTMYRLKLSNHEWSVVSTNGTLPDGRYYIPHAYTSTKLYIYGGDRASGDHANDLWEFNLTTHTWNELHNGSGTAPVGSYGTAMVYNNGSLYIFAGMKSNGTKSNETWEFNLSTETWNQLSLSPSPGARHSPAYATDASNNLYIHGGYNNSGVSTIWKLTITAGTPTTTTTNRVGIGTVTPTKKLDVVGDGIFSGSVTSNGNVLSSDDRIKHNEHPITNALSTISKISPKHYFKTGNNLYLESHNFELNSQNQPLSDTGIPLIFDKDYTIETGIIAQDIQSIPELRFAVQNTTPLGIDYNSIHCTHIAATNELHQIVKTQQIEIQQKTNQQQTYIEEQQQEIETLKLFNIDSNNLINQLKQENQQLKQEIQTIKQHLGL